MGALTLGAGVLAAGVLERRVVRGASSRAAVSGAAVLGALSLLVAVVQSGYVQAAMQGGPDAGIAAAGALLVEVPLRNVVVLSLAAVLGWGLPLAYTTLAALYPLPARKPDLAVMLVLGAGLVPLPAIVLLAVCYHLAARLGGVRRGVTMARDEVLHITTRGEWELAQRDGAYAPPSLAAEGFIHLSSPAQVAATAARYYAGRRDLVVLVLDAASIEPGVLRWEPSTGGELFPHLYRPIEPTEVVTVRRLEPPG